jgi:hypothetical protein
MFFNSKLHTGPETCQRSQDGMVIGDIIQVTMTKGDAFNFVRFAAKADKDYNQAKLIVEALRRDLQKTIKVWAVDGQGGQFFQGELVKVETISDIKNNLLIDEISITINIPIV